MRDELPDDGQRYLRRLRSNLASLPRAERDEIVEELRAHLVERYASGRTDVLDSFGAPEEYAAQFIAEHTRAASAADGPPSAVRERLLRKARALVEALFVAPLFVVQGVCVLLIVLAALKVFFFHRFGYFTNPNGTMWIGLSDNASDSDVLGWWTVPLFIVPSIAVLWASQRITSAMARRRLARVGTGDLAHR